MKEENRQEELDKLAPKLKQLLDQEQEQAALPQNYFQNFETRLQQRLATEHSLEPTLPSPKEPSWKGWWQHIWRPLTAFALPALLLLLWFGLAPSEDIEVASFAALSDQEIEQYIDQNLEDFTAVDLLAVADGDVLDAWEEEEMTNSLPPASEQSSFEKAMESTQSEGLLEELTTEDLSLEEDWF